MSLVPFAAQALTVSPPKIELTADPGKTISGSFLVSNEQQSKKTFYTTFENFEAQGETGVPKFVAATEGLGAWITGVSQVTLDPGQEKKIEHDRLNGDGEITIVDFSIMAFYWTG